MNPILYGFSPVYAATVALRNAAFNAGLFEIHRIPVPVISIGNITAGGTGKTPVVAYTASLLIERGTHAAIVSRGYRRTSRGTVVVSAGEGPLTGAAHGGDEPVMLAMHAPGAAVISDEDRVRGCLLAFERYEADAIVLDDAFQHRRCDRDLDVVVYDARTLPRAQSLLPAGRLREPMRNIARADFILLSRCESQERADAVMEQLARYTDAPSAAVRFVPAGARAHGSLAIEPAESLRGRRAYAFCGIGAPETFERTLSDTGIEPTGMRAFRDHHRYSPDELEALRRDAERSGADMLVTTEKDAVRLAGFKQRNGTLPLYSIVMGMEFIQGRERYEQAVLNAAGMKRT